MAMNDFSMKYISFLIIMTFILLTFQPLFGLKNCSAEEEFPAKDDTEHFSNSDKCYGLVIPLIYGENLPYTSIQQSITNMINDLLRAQISVFWAASNFSVSSRKLMNDSTDTYLFEQGTFIVPFTGNNLTDALIVSIVHDYEYGSEIESYFPVDVYYLMQPFSIQVYPLKYPKAAFHFGIDIDHWCLIEYSEILHSGGFFDTEFLFDDEIEKRLNTNDFNLFVWPGGRTDSIESVLQSSANRGLCKSVRNFVNNGGGFVGSCYGALAASSGVYLPIHLVQSYFRNLPAIGWLAFTSSSAVQSKCGGYITVRLQDMGHPVSYGLEKIQKSFIAGGPVFFQQLMNRNTQTLGVLESLDIVYWAKQNHVPERLREKFIDFLVGNPIWISSQFGEGKVVVFGDHPEFQLPSRNDRLIDNAVFYTTAGEKTTISLNHTYFFSEILNWCSLTNNLTLPEYTPLFYELWKMTNMINVTCGNIDETSKNVFVNAAKLSVEGKEDKFFGRANVYQDSFQRWIEKFSKAVKQLERVSAATNDIESINVNISSWYNHTQKELLNCTSLCTEVLGSFQTLNEKIVTYSGTSLEKIHIAHLFNTLDKTYRKTYNVLTQLWTSTIKLYRACWYFYEREKAVHSPLNQQTTEVSFLQTNITSILSDVGLNIPGTIYVDDDASWGGNGSNEHPYQHIQDAIDASHDGDTIFVAEGIYYEHLSVGKRITLIGTDKNTTIIDGENMPHHLVWVTQSNVEISGFTIRNSATRRYSCGVVLYSSNNTITGNIFKNNCVGVGMDSESQTNVIKDNVFLQNVFAGLIIDTLSQINNNITKNIFVNNSLYGLYTVNNYNRIKNNYFVNNGLTIEASAKSVIPEIINNTVNGKPLICYKNINNFHIADAGEIILSNCTNGVIDTVTLSNTDTGISIINSSDIQIMNCSIFNDLVGIALQSSTNISLCKNCLWNNNWTSVWLSETNRSHICNNSFSKNGEGAYLYSSSENRITHNNFTVNGVGISCWSSSNTNDVSENNFINNYQNAFDNCHNQWNSNYWDDWIGLQNGVLKFLPYHIKGRVLLNYDRHPALTPYEIE